MRTERDRADRAEKNRDEAIARADTADGDIEPPTPGLMLQWLWQSVHGASCLTLAPASTDRSAISRTR
jgi:hypothetical protein